jgi:hypothetical protein
VAYEKFKETQNKERRMKAAEKKSDNKSKPISKLKSKNQKDEKSNQIYRMIACQ